MGLSTLTKSVVGVSLVLCVTACSETAGSTAATATHPATQTPLAPPGTAQSPVMTPAPTTVAPAAMSPASSPPDPAMQPAPAKPPEMTPPATAPMGMGAGGAAATPPATTPDPSGTPGAKEYSYEEVLMLKRDDLIKAWSDAPAKEVWVGCSGKFTELRHATDGTPMSALPAGGWGGKCIPTDTKVLYNIVMGMPTAVGSAMTANRPAEVKESFMDMKPAVVVVYPGGYELHFCNMGKNLWVGRQAMGGAPSGVWYPLGDITGDGMRE
jgi:hypothetical protein